MKEQKYFNLTKLEERIKHQLREHREKSKLTLFDVAERVGKSMETYRRWESQGKHLTCIYDLAEVFRVLDFSTAEIRRNRDCVRNARNVDRSERKRGLFLHKRTLCRYGNGDNQ